MVNEPVRLQAWVCEEVRQRLESVAFKAGRSQAWVVGWAIRSCLARRDVFVRCVACRISRPGSYPVWGLMREGHRVGLRVDARVGGQLLEWAGALNQSPVGLAGLMVDIALEAFGSSLVSVEVDDGEGGSEACGASAGVAG